MSRLSATPIALVFVLAWPSFADAQGKDAFVQGLIQVAGAVDGTFGDEGPALVEGIEAMAAGLAQWDAAIARAEAGLAAEVGAAPPQIAARMRAALGTIYLERGRLDAALAQFSRAAELDPQFPDVQVLRGTSLSAAGRVPEAAAAYRSAWERDRDSPAIAYLFLRSTSDVQSPDAQAAQRTLTAAVQRQAAATTATDALRFLIVSLLDDASVPEPAFVPAAYADAFALLVQSRYDAAVTRLREVAAVDSIVTDPALRSPSVRSAIAALRKDETSLAIAGLSAAAEQMPESPEIHRVLGVAYWSAGQYDKSLEQLRTSVRLNPRDERARLATADVLAVSGALAEARESLADTVQAMPGSSRAAWKLGRLHQEFGDGLNAVRAFTTAAERMPYVGAGRLFAAIGALQQAQLDLVSAAAIYERRVAINPNHATAHADLGDVYLAQERDSDAMREFLVAALLEPGAPRAFAAIGQLLVTQGRDEGAVPMLRKAVRLDATHLEARYALSRALLRLGRTEEAREELAAFQRLQEKTMEDERRRFQENQITIERTLKDGAGR